MYFIFMIAFSKQFRITINSLKKYSVFHFKQKAEHKRGLYLDFQLLSEKKLYLVVLPETQNQIYQKLTTVSRPS